MRAHAQDLSSPAATPEDVLAFWFDAALGDPDYGRPREIWFERDDAFDESVRARLGEAHEAAARGALDAWASRGRGALALVILFDQVPRNIFRGTPRAFATDAKARAVAGEAIAQGHDRRLLPVERLFLYLPFEHSEQLADQERSIALFAAIDQLPDWERTMKAVLRHHEIIARFGRFPHRNAVLGRDITPEEAAFLQEPHSSF
jgi:uncharacterized protein (DUF924 family)